MKSAKELKQHIKSLPSMGGKALLAKKGKKYFSKLAQRRWDKAREQE